jgi:Zn-dependent protease
MLQASFSRPILAFRLLGIPVQVEPSFVLASFLLAGGNRAGVESFLVWLGVVFASIVVHELGHATAGRRFGLVPAIRLYGWGGLTSWTSGPAPGPGRRLVISLAGPIAGFVLGGACYVARWAAPPGAVVLRNVLGMLVYANGTWGLVNLLPILPLDGGHACEALLARFAPAHEERGAQIVSAVTGVGAGALALVDGWMLPGAMAVWLGVDSARAWLRAGWRRRDESLRARVGPGFEAAIEARDGEALVALAAGALPEARLDETRRWIAEHLAIGHALRGAFAEAVAALAKAPPGAPAGVAVEAFVVELAVNIRVRDLATVPEDTALPGGPPEARTSAVSPGGREVPWEAACERLRGNGDGEIDAIGFARVREAGDVLGRHADAARLGEDLFARAPDPDLAFALVCAWAAADDAGRAGHYAKRAVDLGFRYWEAAASSEALSGRGGELARGVFERMRGEEG